MEDQEGNIGDAGIGISETTDTNTEGKSGYYKRYKVLLHNDSKTTMQFVIDVLRAIFNKDHLQAAKLMLEVHEKGFGLAGVYPKEQAEFRIDQTKSLARARGFPLSLSMEAE